LDEAARAAGVYRETIRRLRNSASSVSLSIKASQLGLDVSRQVALELLAAVVDDASSIPTGVRLDMEDSAHTDGTLWLWRELGRLQRPVGVVLQASLYRTPNDLAEVIAAHGSVRLCKGAYLERPEVAYPRKSDVDRAYGQLLETLLDYAAVAPLPRPGDLPVAAIATHDERLIRRAIELVRQLNLDARRYEFQMLFGVRRDLQERLVDAGFPVRVYTPWGPSWYPYLTRRLAERPANLFFLASALLAEATSQRGPTTTPPRAPAAWR
jgi:proline dehydrogenase